jgi:hypothetical protein
MQSFNPIDRGAGHNFGIALEATFNVYPQAHGGIHYSWDLEFELEKCGEVFETLNAVHEEMPPDLAIFVLWKRESPGGYEVGSIAEAPSLLPLLTHHVEPDLGQPGVVWRRR